MKKMTGRTARLVGAVAIALATTTTAMARPDTRAMTCEQVQSTIRKAGAVVMTTGRHTYERFVRGRSYCLHPDVAWGTTVKTRDRDRCPVLHCVPRNLVWPDNFFD